MGEFSSGIEFHTSLKSSQFFSASEDSLSELALSYTLETSSILGLAILPKTLSFELNGTLLSSKLD